jgi:hypothetical protein
VKFSAALIVAGYVALVVLLGWPGLLAAALHIGILLLCVPRK